MPRHPRLFLPGATYHVYCRVVRGEFVFDEVARVINKHRNSVTKWLNKGLRREGTDPEFKRRLDDLDAAISSRG